MLRHDRHLPAVVAGAQFPLLIALLGQGRDRVARDVGLAYFWNTIGGIVGALAGGFGLLPILTAPGCWRAAALMLAALALAALLATPDRPRPVIVYYPLCDGSRWWRSVRVRPWFSECPGAHMPHLPVMQWDFKDQPPEFWDQFNTDFPPGTHLRVHPLLHWTELDIWRYTKRENIPLISLYFAKDGKRYRSLGDKDITFPVDSHADTIDAIIEELKHTRVSERSGRAMDHEAEDSFERLRAEGYM